MRVTNGSQAVLLRVNCVSSGLIYSRWFGKREKTNIKERKKMRRSKRPNNSFLYENKVFARETNILIKSVYKREMEEESK